MHSQQGGPHWKAALANVGRDIAVLERRSKEIAAIYIPSSSPAFIPAVESVAKALGPRAPVSWPSIDRVAHLAHVATFLREELLLVHHRGPEPPSILMDVLYVAFLAWSAGRDDEHHRPRDQLQFAHVLMALGVHVSHKHVHAYGIVFKSQVLSEEWFR
jgi:hypothetical protein